MQLSTSLVLLLLSVQNIYSQQQSTKQTSLGGKEKVHIDFVGTGNLQSSLAQGDEIQGSAGLGVIYERFRGDSLKYNNELLPIKGIKSFEMEAIINVASTVDTLSVNFENGQITNQRDFGSYVLNPFSSKQSLFINSNVYFNPDGDYWLNKIAKYLSGLNFRVTASNGVWSDPEIGNVNLGVIAYRFGIFHEFLPDDYIRTDEKKSKYSVFLGLNMGYRGIFGDVTSDANDEIRTSILGSDRTDFSGIELNFGFRLDNIRAEFQMPFLYGSDRKSISGLTDTQFLFTIRFVGGFSLKIDPDKKTENNDKANLESED
ncbi:hypothetical protein [Arenibacter sp. ARW7G5Y1]|uniref:hypothetical protein n=1 Tax=Arenibacter sp. ARW7G5Y1 TaxID=2135619 RepID=UPI000D76CFAC|nr:hypothetical protein [Arenibacter sp. ARW7G5Y1]PXX29718.1 hypothetical protein C7972_10387 [Arenibacter sp. ARW7G5Y1]